LAAGSSELVNRTLESRHFVSMPRSYSRGNGRGLLKRLLGIGFSVAPNGTFCRCPINIGTIEAFELPYAVCSIEPLSLAATKE
jgi:hypothetical protein